MIDAEVYGRLNVNVAFSRPTFMSSVYSDPLFGGDYASSRGNDGNKDPIAMQVGNSCVHTNVGFGWLVDDEVCACAIVVLSVNVDI